METKGIRRIKISKFWNEKDLKLQKKEKKNLIIKYEDYKGNYLLIKMNTNKDISRKTNKYYYFIEIRKRSERKCMEN